MHVDAVLVLRRLVEEVVGEAEHGGEFVPGLRIEVGVAAAGIDCAVADTQVRQPSGIVGSHRDIAGDVGHEVVNACVPAQRELRDGVAKAGDGILATAGQAESEGADRGIQRRVHGDIVASHRHQQRHRRLAAQHRGREHVARNRHHDIRIGIEVRVQISAEIGGDVAARDLTRERDVGSGRYPGVIIKRGEGGSGLLRRCRKAAEEARHPEADAAFVRRGDRGRQRERAEQGEPTLPAAQILRLWSSSCPPDAAPGAEAEPPHHPALGAVHRQTGTSSLLGVVVGSLPPSPRAHKFSRRIGRAFRRDCWKNVALATLRHHRQTGASVAPLSRRGGGGEGREDRAGRGPREPRQSADLAVVNAAGRP